MRVLSPRCRGSFGMSGTARFHAQGFVFLPSGIRCEHGEKREPRVGNFSLNVGVQFERDTPYSASAESPRVVRCPAKSED
jgi:hypothetical protein